MPEEPEAPPRSQGGIGSKLTKKVGPLPLWAWVAGGGAAAFLLYRWYSARQAASASSATTATQPTTSDGTSSTPGSNGYQDVPGLGTLQQELAALQQQINGGTSSGSGTSLGSYVPITSGPAALAAAQAGTPLYQETAPGVFSLYTGGIAGIENAIKLGWSTHATQLFAQPNGTISGAGGSATPPAQTGGTTAGTGGAPAPVQPSGPSLGGVPSGSYGGATAGTTPKIPTSIGGTPTQASAA